MTILTFMIVKLSQKKFHPNKKSFASKNSQYFLCVGCPHFPIKRAICEQIWHFNIEVVRVWKEIFFLKTYSIFPNLGGEDISHGTDVSVQLAGENSGATGTILFTNSPLGSILVKKEQKAESDQKFYKNKFFEARPWKVGATVWVGEESLLREGLDGRHF